LKKGEWIGAGQIAGLEAAGVDEILGARLEAGEVDENEAARRLAEALAGANLNVDMAFTGRCNLRSNCSGLFMVNAAVIDRVNMIDETITIATLKPFRRVVEGEMVATAKIISLCRRRRRARPRRRSRRRRSLARAPFRPLRVGVVSTLRPDLKSSTVEKALRALDERLAPAGGNHDRGTHAA